MISEDFSLAVARLIQLRDKLPHGLDRLMDREVKALADLGVRIRGLEMMAHDKPRPTDTSYRGRQ